MRSATSCPARNSRPRAARPGAGARRAPAGSASPRLDLGPLPPVERRAGPEPVRLVGDRRDRDHAGAGARDDRGTCPTLRIHPAAVIAQARRPRGAARRPLRGSASAAARRSTSTSSASHWPDGRRAAGDARGGIVHARAVGGRPGSATRAPLPVENARIYTRPTRRSPVLVSGFGPKSSSLAARIGDGFAAVTRRGVAGRDAFRAAAAPAEGRTGRHEGRWGADEARA